MLIEYGSLVANPSVAGPAVLAIGGHLGNNTFVTPNAVGFNESFATIGNWNWFGNYTRVKVNQVFSAVDSLPDKMVDEIVIGKMTVNALYGSMQTGHKPRLVLLVHHMAAVTELRRWSDLDEYGRGSCGKNAQNRNGYT